MRIVLAEPCDDGWSVLLEQKSRNRDISGVVVELVVLLLSGERRQPTPCIQSS